MVVKTKEIMVAVTLLVNTAGAFGLPACQPPLGLDAAEDEHYCMIHMVRSACLVQKGFDIEPDNWVVPLSAYDECTILGCDQLLEQTGFISDNLFRLACNIARFDLGK